MPAHRLTVMQVLPALNSGGVERSTLEIAHALVQAGHRALVVSAGGRLVPQLEALGATHVCMDVGQKSLRTLRCIRPLRALMQREGVHIVHARSRLPAWVAWRALAPLPPAARPRFVTTVHGLNSPSRYSAIMARGERVICVSHTVAAYVRAHYPWVDATTLRVIPRGIDVAQFPPRTSVETAACLTLSQHMPALAGEGPLLLLPGRGTRLKGHADAIALLAALVRHGVDARLWMPGAREPGRERYIAELEAQAQAEGVLARVGITPPTHQIAEALRLSDLVLQLSRKPEAFGRTVVEALATGVPVLGWAHGGVGELLAQLQPAGAVVPFDHAQLVQRALKLLAAPPQAVAIPYTLAAMQQATLDVYAELCPPSV